MVSIFAGVGDEATVGRGVFTLQAWRAVIDDLLRVLGLDVRRRRTIPQKHDEKS